MTRRILVADDSATVRKVFELTFSEGDFEVTAVGDGLQALERARADRPDIVIADVAMPGLNGYELCERMKADAALRRLPFLLLRGSSGSFDGERAGACGADGAIVKPFEAQAVIAKVTETINAAAAATVVPEPPAAAARPAPPPPPRSPALTPPPPPPPPAAPRAPAAPPPTAPPAPPPPTRPVSAAAPAAALFEDEDFDFGPSEPAAPSPAGANDDLWSEVNLRGATVPVMDAVAGEDTFWGSLAGTAAPAGGGPAASGAGRSEMTAPAAADPPASAPPPAADAGQIEGIVAARLDAAVRQALEPLIAQMARPMLEEIAWQVIPELAEAMIRAEVERIARSADGGRP